MKKHKYILLLLLIIMSPLISPDIIRAEEDKYFTWKDVTSSLTATDVVKKKVENMLNFEVGYSITKIDKNAVAPTISSVKIIPSSIPADGKTIFVLVASVYNPGGVEDLRVVKADLSQVGRLPNSILGLTKKLPISKGSTNFAGIYVLENSVSTSIRKGEKEVKISAANKKGWLSLSKTNISITR